MEMSSVGSSQNTQSMSRMSGHGSCGKMKGASASTETKNLEDTTASEATSAVGLENFNSKGLLETLNPQSTVDIKI